MEQFAAGDADVLLTNDDGIEAPGLAALEETLSAVADVTVVAPADDRSGVGRARSFRAAVTEHPRGYALEGTPADCVAYGLRGLDRSFDLVVSGCNHGPNTGNYVVGRSGTVGACIEAGFLGTPAVAVSAYHAEDFFISPPEEYEFGEPAYAARELAIPALSAGAFGTVDILNVNAPVDVHNPSMRLTEPYHDYEVDVEHGIKDDRDGDVAIRDAVWPDTVGWENPFPATDEHRERYPVGTDRRALVDGEISVSPLVAPALAARTGPLEDVVGAFNEDADRRSGTGTGAGD